MLLERELSLIWQYFGSGICAPRARSVNPDHHDTLLLRISRLTSSCLTDLKRIPTDLVIKHMDGPPVTTQAFKTAKEEAQYIAKDIKHKLDDPDQIFTADDFAILLRLNALSRNIEFALKTEGIPYKMAGWA